MRNGIRLTFAALAVWAVWLAPVSHAQESADQWQEKTQIVWDAGAAKLVRRSFRVWDPYPELDLEFHWSPETESGKQAGALSGAGVLTWYRRGAARHDYASRHSVYKGTLRNGRPDGQGKLSVRLGLTYEGTWKNGRMEGEGAIEYETGVRYRGRFLAGRPDGSGTYIAANGQVIEASEAPPSAKPFAAAVAKAWARAPFALSPLKPRPTPVQAAPMAVAQTSGPITMNLYVDRAMNTWFKEASPEFASYVYGQSKAGDRLNIRLDAPEIMARWQGDDAITADENTTLLEPAQFAPVFLVVDVINDSDRDAQITGGYVDVAQSDTVWEPYLEITGIWYFADEDAFDPTFIFVNEGWGPAQNAKITYSFGQRLGGGAQSFVIDAGTFDQSKEVSTRAGFEGSGADVSRLAEARYPCPSYERVPACLTNLKRSGLFGGLAEMVYAEDNRVFVQIAGAIEYDWTDAQGSIQHRRSPISVKLPVLTFVVGPVVEYGAPEAINRRLPAIKLGLDAKNYRIPLKYRERLGAQQNKRVALTLDAARSSHHQFRIVLQLADGSTIATPPADLLMFKPRAVQLY